MVSLGVFSGIELETHCVNVLLEAYWRDFTTCLLIWTLSLLDSGNHKLNNSSHFSLSCLEGSMVDRQAPREPHSVTSDPYC